MDNDGLDIQENDDENSEEGEVNEDETNEDLLEQRMDYELETSWEPQRSGTNHGHSALGMDTAIEESDEDDNSIFDAASRLSAEGRTSRGLPRIVRYSSKYPQSRVGAVVSVGESSDARYSSTLG